MCHTHWRSRPSFRSAKRLILLCGLMAVTVTVHAQPRVPSDDNEVLEHLPMRPGDAQARELTQLRAAIASAPTDPIPAAAMAQRYFDLAMARGDPRYVGYAEAVIKPFSQTQSTALLLTRGLLRQYRHQFGGALDDFAAALAIDPQFASAHAWRAAIYLVQANYPAAQRECDQLQRLKRSTLYGGCVGLVQAYSGSLDLADVSLQHALKNATDADNRLWLLTRLGEVSAWRGQSARAEKYYREAVNLGIDDGYLLAAWSDFLLDRKRPAEVVKLLAKWESSDGLLLRLALAEASLNLPAAPRHIQALDDRFAAARLRGDTTHRAEEARFQLHLRGNASAALKLASANYQVQREPRDARILLEAALAAHAAAPAQPVRDWLKTSGFEDPTLRQLGLALFPAQRANGVTEKVQP